MTRPPGEGVDAEQRRELEDDARAMARARPAACTSLHRRLRDAQVQQPDDDADRRVQHEHGPQRIEPSASHRGSPASRAAPPRARPRRRRSSRRSCSARRRSCGSRRSKIAASTVCSSGRNTLTSPPLGLSGPMNATTSSGQSVGEGGEAEPGRRHQHRCGQQQPAQLEAMTPAPDGERRDRGAEQRCGAEKADLELALAERQQVGGQEHRDESVGEGAQSSRREHEGDHRAHWCALGASPGGALMPATRRTRPRAGRWPTPLPSRGQPRRASGCRSRRAPAAGARRSR